MAILLAWQALLIGGLSWAIGWWAYPVLWLFPVFVFTYLGDNLRSFVEHSHPESDAKADEHRLVTHTSNRLERLFVAPMNMNFHAAHHLWVGIPYYNLPHADRLMREHPGSSALEWRRSYSPISGATCARRRSMSAKGANDDHHRAVHALPAAAHRALRPSSRS